MGAGASGPARHPGWAQARPRQPDHRDRRHKGKPYTQTGFQTRFFGLLKRLKEEGKIGAGLSFHGLRHTVGRKLAEAGCDARTIAAILGHMTTAMAEHYSRHADRRYLARAAITKLERNV